MLSNLKITGTWKADRAVAVELLSSPEDIKKIIYNVNNIEDIAREAKYKTVSLGFQELTQITLLRRLMTSKFPQNKKGLLATYTCIFVMCMSSHILQTLWTKIKLDPGLLDDEDTKIAAFIMVAVTKMKWLSHAMILSFLYVASE